MPRKIKQAEVAGIRATMLEAQGGRCAVCKQPLTAEQAVLDHDHDTGAIRGVLHRTCNGLLGKIENGVKRWGIRNLAAFLSGVSIYINSHITNRTDLVHHTFKTAEEKRLARNAKARANRRKNSSDRSGDDTDPS